MLWCKISNLIETSRTLGSRNQTSILTKNKPCVKNHHHICNENWYEIAYQSPLKYIHHPNI